MIFTYIGAAQETVAFGLRFPRGVGVEVTDPHAVGKLTNSIEFTHEKARETKGLVPPTVNVAPAPAVASLLKQSTPQEDVLVARAKDKIVLAGKRVDRRWSDARILEEAAKL